MAKWYDEYLTDQEKKNLQIGQKGIRARERKKTQESNVANAQQQTREREAKQGEAYAKKMQKDSARSKEILSNAFLQKTYKDSKRKR